MDERGWELIASNEPTTVTKPLLDATVMKNGQCDGCLADSASTGESNRSQVFGEPDYAFDQFVASKTGPRRWGRRFTRWAGCEYKGLCSLVISVVDMVRPLLLT